MYLTESDKYKIFSYIPVARQKSFPKIKLLNTLRDHAFKCNANQVKEINHGSVINKNPHWEDREEEKWEPQGVGKSVGGWPARVIHEAPAGAPMAVHTPGDSPTHWVPALGKGAGDCQVTVKQVPSSQI